MATVNEFFARFGCPFQIFTDQGRNFESKLFSDVCELLQVHKARTTPYPPAANGQVERYNRTLMDAVQCSVDKAQNCWDEHLTQIAGALRSAVNRNASLCWGGRSIILPISISISALLAWGMAAG